MNWGEFVDLNKRQFLAAAALVGGSSTSAHAAPPQSVAFSVWAEINAVTQGYADCLDRYDLGGLQLLFLPNCVYEYSPGLTMNGQEQVAEGARISLAGVSKSSHFVGPPTVQFGPDPSSYTSVVYFTAFHEQKDGGHHTVWGRYIDLFKPDASGRLRISHRQTVGHVAQGTNATRFWLDRAPS